VKTLLCKYNLLLAALSLYLSPANSFAIPTVTNCTTTVYTNLTDPVMMSFAPDGSLFVGRDNSGSGGSSQDAVKIHKIGPNASSLAEYGNTAITDPDAVAFDAVGLVSGAAGNVLVGGSAAGSTANISRIGTNGGVAILFGGAITNIGNPRQMIFDAAGRLYISDTDFNRVVTTASSAAPTILCVSTGANAMVFDVSNRLAVASYTLPRIQLFSTNGTLLNSNLATIAPTASLAAGKGDSFWGTDLYSFTSSGQLIRIDPNGNVTPIGNGFSTGMNFAMGNDGALYVSYQLGDVIYKIKPTPRTPQHWWPLDGNLLDVIGSENGHASNGTFFATGKLGEAFDFNGTNYINFGTNAGSVGGSDFTATLWVKTLSSFTASCHLLSWETNSCPVFNYYWRVSLVAVDSVTSYAASDIFAGNFTQLSGSGTTDVEDGNWHHLALVRQGVNCFMYRDGILDFTRSAANLAVVTSVGRLIAGHNLCSADGNGAQYRGQLDEIKLFGVALTQAEVIADMNPPRLNIAALPGAVRLTWSTNSSGFALETNSSLTLTNWGVLTTNYSIIATNYAVTNAVGGETRFYRLHKP
jgi:hypothetical protein